MFYSCSCIIANQAYRLGLLVHAQSNKNRCRKAKAQLDKHNISQKAYEIKVAYSEKELKTLKTYYGIQEKLSIFFYSCSI